MKLSEINFGRTTIKWILNLFPPLLFNRISIKSISEDFKQVHVQIRYSWMNKNFNRTIFGGTISSAIDPYLPTMYWHIFSRKKLPMEVWSKSIEVNFIKPAITDLDLFFSISNEDVDNAMKGLQKDNIYEHWHYVNVIDQNENICAEAKVLVFLRNYKDLKIKSL